MTDSDLPYVQAVLMQIDKTSKRTDAYLWIVSSCPFCGKYHSHAGGASDADPRARLGRHTAPCGKGEYNLVELAPAGISP